MVESAPVAPRAPVLTRRSFVTAGLFLGAAACIPGVRLLTGPSSVASLPPLATFIPHVGSSFSVDEGPVVTLVSARTTGPHGSGAYSLVFRARPGAPPIGDRIEGLRHPALGRLRLFIAPVGRGIEGQGYEAIVAARVPTTKRGS